MTLTLQNITYARANPSLWYVIVKRETPVTYYNHKGSIGEMNKTSTLQTLTVVLTVLVLSLMAFQVTILNIRVNILLSNRGMGGREKDRSTISLVECGSVPVQYKGSNTGNGIMGQKGCIIPFPAFDPLY